MSTLATPTARANWPLAVLFDFDGVIVNSEPLHCAAYIRLMAELGIALTERQYYQELIGFDDRGAIRHMLTQHGQPADAGRIEQLKARVFGLMQDTLSQHRVPALPGVDAFVRSLARTYPIGICSGAVKPEIEVMLDGIGLREFFPVIVAADDVAVGKPDPMGYLLATKLIGKNIGRTLTPADVLIVEDAPTVIASVRRAGFSVLAVTTSHPAEELGQANWIVDTLEPTEVSAKVAGLKLM